MSDRTHGTQGADHADTPGHRLHLDVCRLDVFIRSDGPDGPTLLRPSMVTCRERGSGHILGFEICPGKVGSMAVERLLKRNSIRRQPQ
jgi:hypothetical protein